MRLASTKQRPEEGETLLATEPFQRFLANMVETAHSHFQMHCHAKLRPYTTAHILTFLVAFHNILISPENITEADHQRNWYVVVWDNTPTASGAAPPTKLCISEPHQSSWCWIMNGSPLCACLLCRLWKSHVVKLMWVRFRGGWDARGISSLGAWQGKMVPVMWTRRCGQTQLCGNMLPNYSSHLFFLPLYILPQFSFSFECFFGNSKWIFCCRKVNH